MTDKHTCSQSENIIWLQKDFTSISNSLKEIKDDVKEYSSKLDSIISRLDKLPNEFTSKTDFKEMVDAFIKEKEANLIFRSTINTKISFYSAGIGVAVSMAMSYLKKFF